MKVDIKLNPAAQIISDHGLQKDGPATKFLRDTVDRYCDPYIPMSLGSGVHVKDLKTYPSNHEIEYRGSHAHYHYRGILMLAKNGSSWAKLGEKKYYTGKKLKYQGAPKRGSEWDKRMWADRGKEICNQVEDFVRYGC